MKLKTLLLLPTLLVVCLYSQLTLADHWLLGIEGGYASRSGTLNTSYDAPPLPGVIQSNSVNLSDNGFIYGFLGGYQWDFYDHWIFGIEGNINWNNIDEARQYNFLDAGGAPVSETARYERGTVYGLSARLGYRIHAQALPFDLLPYVRAGGHYSSDDLTISFNDTVPPAIATFTNDKSVFAWLVGAGLEVPLIDQLVLRGEYNYSRSEKFDMHNSFATGFAPIPIISSHHDYKPRTHVGKLQLVWNFC